MSTVQGEKFSWSMGGVIGRGGFGKVFAAAAGSIEGAAKFLPRGSEADREVLFSEIDGGDYVIPIIDRAVTDDHVVLFMPRASKSLRDEIDKTPSGLSIESALAVIRDVASGLSALKDKIVHRDLKPENVLFYEDRWCLADFGIARYAEATTAQETLKEFMSAPYASPEQWRLERATPATDIYALGIVMYELLQGAPPYLGPRRENYRQQHLTGIRDPLDHLPATIASLIDECLSLEPAARPSSENVVERLKRFVERRDRSEGRLRLQEAYRAEISRQTKAQRAERDRQEAEQERYRLCSAGLKIMENISKSIREELLTEVPRAHIYLGNAAGWRLEFGGADLLLGPVECVGQRPWTVGGRGPEFDVVAWTELRVKMTNRRQGEFLGRSHSLWYCDAGVEGEFGWYDLAFAENAILGRRPTEYAPFALAPANEAGLAFGQLQAPYILAKSVVRLYPGELDEFIDQWANWLALAADNLLAYPTKLPEDEPVQGWRLR